MIIRRRRCRRYCLNRTMVLLLSLFSTLATMTWSYSYFSRLFLDRYTDVDEVYLIDESDLKDAQMPSSRHLRLLSKEFFNTTHLACHYPKLTVDNADVWKHLEPVTKSRPECEKSINWVYVENGPSSSRQMFIRTESLSFHFQGPFDYRRAPSENTAPLSVPIVRFFARRTISRRWKARVSFPSSIECRWSRTSSAPTVEHGTEVSTRIFIRGSCSTLAYT